MYFLKIRYSILFSLISILFLILTFQSAKAATYAQLQNKGYSTSRLTQSAGGAGGWIVAKGGDKYFCKIRAGNVYAGSGKIIMLGYTGKNSGMKVDRRVFEELYKSKGGDLRNIPRYSDLKSGRIKAQHVGRCQKLR